MYRAVLSLAALIAVAPSLSAQKAEPQFVPGAIGVRPAFVARAKAALAAEPLVVLGPAALAAPDQLNALRSWNDSSRVPMKNGFTRRLPSPVDVRIPARGISAEGFSSGGGRVDAAVDGSMIWSGSFRVQDAERLRLHLTGVALARGAVLRVHGAEGDAVAFGGELVDANGSLYTPAVSGSTIHLEVEMPASSAFESRFAVSDVVELLVATQRLRESSTGLQPGANDAPTCLIDATCITSSSLASIDQLRSAVAHLEYMKQGNSYVCTGTLLNDRDTSTTVPYLLTANHCFSDQSAASSLEAYWDYRTASCEATFPPISSLTRTNGSTLLTTGPASDFTLVRLNSTPASRWLLGWDASASATPVGTILYRISHPFPDAFSVPAAQAYSTTRVTTPDGTCQDWPLGSYLYQTIVQGGVYGGSSGSAVVNVNGSVVGQLSGGCGVDPSAGCDPTVYTVDGALSASWPSLAPFLSPTAGTSACIPNGTTACLLNNRFKATVRYRNGFDNGAADADAQAKTASGFSSSEYETAFFYFNSPNNVEMLLKMLDQGNTNGSGQRTIAVLFGSATPLRLEVRITDTQTGVVKSYTSAFGGQAGTTDFTAFVK